MRVKQTIRFVDTGDATYKRISFPNGNAEWYELSKSCASGQLSRAKSKSLESLYQKGGRDENSNPQNEE